MNKKKRYFVSFVEKTLTGQVFRDTTILMSKQDIEDSNTINIAIFKVLDEKNYNVNQINLICIYKY